jgi:hypothetical protein
VGFNQIQEATFFALRGNTPHKKPPSQENITAQILKTLTEKRTGPYAYLKSSMTLSLTRGPV